MNDSMQFIDFVWENHEKLELEWADYIIINIERAEQHPLTIHGIEQGLQRLLDAQSPTWMEALEAMEISRGTTLLPGGHFKVPSEDTAPILPVRPHQHYQPTAEHIPSTQYNLAAPKRTSRLVPDMDSHSMTTISRLCTFFRLCGSDMAVVDAIMYDRGMQELHESLHNRGMQWIEENLTEEAQLESLHFDEDERFHHYNEGFGGVPRVLSEDYRSDLADMIKL